MFYKSFFILALLVMVHKVYSKPIIIVLNGLQKTDNLYENFYNKDNGSLKIFQKAFKIRSSNTHIEDLSSILSDESLTKYTKNSQYIYLFVIAHGTTVLPAEDPTNNKYGQIKTEKTDLWINPETFYTQLFKNKFQNKTKLNIVFLSCYSGAWLYAFKEHFDSYNTENIDINLFAMTQANKVSISKYLTKDMIGFIKKTSSITQNDEHKKFSKFIKKIINIFKSKSPEDKVEELLKTISRIRENIYEFPFRNVYTKTRMSVFFKNKEFKEKLNYFIIENNAYNIYRITKKNLKAIAPFALYSNTVQNTFNKIIERGNTPKNHLFYYAIKLIYDYGIYIPAVRKIKKTYYKYEIANTNPTEPIDINILKLVNSYTDTSIKIEDYIETIFKTSTTTIPIKTLEDYYYLYKNLIYKDYSPLEVANQLLSNLLTKPIYTNTVKQVVINDLIHDPIFIESYYETVATDKTNKETKSPFLSLVDIFISQNKNEKNFLSETLKFIQLLCHS